MFSTHIVGGEIFYDRINDSTYKVTLKVYRDCFNGQAPFAGVHSGTMFIPAMLTVYNFDNTLVDTFNIGAPIITQIPPTINSPCIQAPGGVCVEEGVYTYTLTLPPKIGGYFVVYQVTFRNTTILNLTAPVTQGATYYTFIPGPETATANSSPRYTKFPPIFICNNVSFKFDHTATDPDGDQLVYSLCAPYNGIPMTGYQATPPPFANVNYVSPYNGAFPIAANPAFTINSSTGILTGRPNLIGQFVVGVRVEEYRGGVLINTHFRDFQFNVVPCIVSVASVFANQIKQCEGTAITFTNQSFGNVGTLSYHWDFGVNGTLADTSQIKNPTYNYSDTGKYVVTLIANPGKPCADTLKLPVYVYPPIKVSFSKQAQQCLKANSFNFNNTGSYINGATYKWNFGSAATPNTSTLKNPSGIIYNQAGSYLVKLVGKQLTCTDSMMDSVRIIGRPKAKINNLPSSFCSPARVGFSNGSSSELPMHYKWLFDNGNVSSDYEPVQIFNSPGVYGATLIVTTSSPCVDTSVASIVNVTVNPTPIAGFSLSPKVTSIFDPQIAVKNTSGSGVTSWYYFLGDGSYVNDTNFIYSYTTPGTYSIMQIVGNNFNCSDTAVEEVRILPEFRFWIPNTFTPNNDGKNDIFIPTAIGVSRYEFFIYDKWGQQIYYGTDPLQGWDGTCKGRKCEQDVYIWKILFINDVERNRENHCGHVLLLGATE